MKSKHGDILGLPESSRLLECGKDGRSNGKLSTFQQRDIALFIFDNSLWHACKAKEAVVGIFGHVKTTCNAQHGIRMELNRGWYS